MKFGSYLKDKVYSILFSFLVILIVAIILIIFNLNERVVILVTILLMIGYIVPFLYEYLKKKYFYNTFRRTLDELDKKYLITEMISNSNFVEGKILLDYLYEIDKSMHEEINRYKYISNELKEYIELWCHEIKTPISTSKLIIENNNNKVTKNILEEIEHIEFFVEQVLYYSRSDTVEKDYIISDVDLNMVINNVIKRNKKDLIGKKIKIEINSLKKVKSDPKWLEFIINQIIVNSIKYSKGSNSLIKIYCDNNKNNTILYIEDNGIGIDNTEVEKVFDKGFTGSNGRKKHNSTGIGLYLCQKLCVKLGHEIFLKSSINKYTIVGIVFPSSSMTRINLTEM